MINVSDSWVVNKNNSYDFEECTAMEIDAWPSKSEAINTACTSSTAHVCKNDESLMSIFAQSIEIFGSSMAPWPNSGKSLPEQVAGIFITSECTSPTDESIQSRLDTSKSQVQSKLRRSVSSTRRTSISRIQEDNFFDSQKLYSELEPIPIVTVERKLSIHVVSKEKDTDLFGAQKERANRSSRLQNWLSSLYARNTSTNSPKSKEENYSSSSSLERKPIKSILKKTSLSLEAQVQKSMTISESEAIKISTNGTDGKKVKKTMKIRFDNEVSVCETFHREDYSRQSLEYVARQLTPSLALAIKKELNTVKQEMEVHEDARHLTQFYLIK